MHCHNMAEGVVEGHPMTHDLVRFLGKQGLSPAWIEFFRTRLHFAYPKTAWLKLDAERPEDVRLRHAIDSHVAGDALAKWLWRPDGFHRVVFDVRGVTILDRQGMLDFFDTLKSPDHPAFLLASKDVGTAFFSPARVPMMHTFREESELLRHLRFLGHHRETPIILPEKLSLLALDEALRGQASDAVLNTSDVAVLDARNVRETEFNGISMLCPALHSIAHKQGILFAIESPTLRFSRVLRKYGPLRIVAPYLVKGLELVSDPQPAEEAALSMKCFTEAETLDIQDLCLAAFNALLDRSIYWFVDRAGLSQARAQSRYDRVAGSSSGSSAKSSRNWWKTFRCTRKALAT